MFREIHDVNQERGLGRRRWFESEGLDLVVWLAPDETVAGFQLCYNFGRGEHALTWRAGQGFAHNEIDTGSATPMKNLTPVLGPLGPAPWAELARNFEDRSATLTPELRQLIRDKLAASHGGTAA